MISLLERIPIGNRAERAYYLYRHIPRRVLKKLEEDNFRRTVAFAAKHSRFYASKFREKGIDPAKVRAPEDLGDLFTGSEDIRQDPEAFLCSKADTAFETTGTTSKRTKRVYYSRHELWEAGWAGAVGLWSVGVRPEDRVASAFDYSFWISGPLLQASCQVIGCFHVEAGRMEVEEFYERLKDYGLTVIVGDPSWILRFTQIAEKKGAWPLKLLVAGGENMTESGRAYIQSVWKAPMILNYGQTEALGTIGIESAANEGYHLNEFHTRFEIVDRDAEGYGELVFTTLNRRVMPLVRYRTGDITRFIEGPSTSGLPGLRIEKLKGRVNEWTATGLGNLAPWMFEPVLGAIGGIGPDWQIVIDKEHDLDRVQLCVEGRGGADDQERLRKEVLNKLEMELCDVWRFQQMGLGRIEVKVCRFGTLRNGRKLSRLVDQRKF